MQAAQFRGFPQSIQPPQRSPHGPTAGPPGLRRGIGSMTAGADHSNALAQVQAQQAAQQQAQQQHAAQLAKRAKIRAKRPTDKNVPEGVEEIIIGDGVQRYRDLRDVERRLDSTMTKKRADLMEAVNRNVKRPRILRIWISNTVEDQPWQADALDVDAFDFSANMDGAYKVKIEGRLLDEEEDDLDSDDSENEADEAVDAMETDSTDKKSKLPQKPYRFSHFFKAMTVDFERVRGKEGTYQSVEWKKPQLAPNGASLPNAADFDQLEFKRGGDENVNITINLTRDENPERCKLAPALADLLDITEATRPECVSGVMDYVRANELQDDDEKRAFDCDDKLRALFGREKMTVQQLSDVLMHHLKSLDPVKLQYTIRCDQAFHSSPNPAPTIYDIRVSVDDPIRTMLASYLINPSYASTLREITEMNNHTAVLVQAVMNGKNRHTFFDTLSKDPTMFLRRWLASQKRDMEVMGGEATRGGGEAADTDEWWRGGEDGIWGSRRARESVGVFVAGKVR